MKYPKLLEKDDTIGICAPSSGIKAELGNRLDNAKKHIEELGYKTIETASVRTLIKCVSANSEKRAKEFMDLYTDNSVAAIMPPWGGEFLMDMLPYLDYEFIKTLPPKWIIGYSDISTLLFVLTVKCDIATVHGSNLMNMGFKEIHSMDLFAFEVMSKSETTQNSSEYCGDYGNNIDGYDTKEKTEYKLLYPQNQDITFSGRMVGGCLDVLCKILGTKYASTDDFTEKYKNDGFIWTLESCEMNAADIYRTLWQMRECGWFQYCSGVLFGRVTGYSDKRDFTLTDALEQSLKDMNVPVIYDADIGHSPPQVQIVNGSYGTVKYSNGKAEITQVLKV